MSISPLQKPRERTLLSFLMALGIAAAIFLPFIILDKGYFIFYGDYNVQQIPFYQMAHDAVRSGNVFWSWTTDLGANFVGSYSFYLLGSPFFWLTLPFPSAMVPYMVAPLLILKMALSSLGAYAYLRRFLKPDYALLGGLLYAFSGFSIYNIFFNHFHEAIVYFPLMLLTMEMAMKDGKRGWFAVAVFFSALSNYYFFIAQAVFLIIYWVIRALSGDWDRVGGRFVLLVTEAVLGAAMAGVLLLPSFLSVTQNPRTDNIIAGWDLLIYTKPQRLLDIIHSFFFPQDIPARASFFPESDNKWSSMTAWLPIFGSTGVIAYFQSRKHTDWVRRLLLVLIVMALIPGLNALFQLFNSMYYARWYYMMVLFLSLATIRAIQDDDEIVVHWKRAFGWAATITAAFALVVGLAPQSWKPDKDAKTLTFGLYNRDYPEFFWVAVALASVSLVLAALLVSLHRRERPLFFRWSSGILTAVILIFGWYSIGSGKVQGRFTSDYVIERAIGSADKINLPGWKDSRVDFCNDMDNLGMYWQVPTIQAFHSIVPGSVMEFYPTVGVDRSVGSRPDTSHYALRGLLSVRWLFDYTNDDETQGKDESSFFTHTYDGDSTLKMPGWSFYNEQNGYMVYENDYYIPFGFTYDRYLSRTDYDAMDKSTRELSLLKAMVLEDEDVKTYGSYLEALSGYNDYSLDYTEEAYLTDCEARRETAASSFTRDNRGFTAVIDLPKDNLVFFSVPYEKGWSATVNGQPATIVKANVGFMAVLCPAGEDVTIRFDYQTPGLLYGLWISLGALALFLLYVLINRLVVRRRRLAIPEYEEIPPVIAEEQPGAATDDEFDLYRLYPSHMADNSLSTDDTPPPEL